MADAAARTRGRSLTTELKRLVSLTPQHDLHIETLVGCGWKVSCCNEDGAWVGWIEGKTLIEAVRAAIVVMEGRP